MKNIFNNLTFGNVQQVGVMSVIPLIGEDATQNIAEFSDVKFHGTSGYGTMVFRNASTKKAIVPSGYSILTKQSAQDHGTPLSSILNPNTVNAINNTCCIEQTQGGYINGENIDSFLFLPIEVRKNFFKNYVVNQSKSDISYADLWHIITSFQSTLVNNELAHLSYFFDKFMDKLMQFNAEFEIVPKQRGAIILLNNKVIGIEITPTSRYWESIWHSLIRYCYGSEIVRLTMLNLIDEFKVNHDEELNLDECTSLEDIQREVDLHNNRIIEKRISKISNVLETEVEENKRLHTIIQRNNNDKIKYSLIAAKNKSFFGELYKEDENVIYCSLLFE